MAKKKSPKTKATQKLPLRPPIVTVMGHVDHGKTSLLDAIRHTRVTAKEFGGITQHIGAYQVKHQDQLITFIDTPGHAAFAEMRARGAHVTDIVVLVVAADDGVKPQTVESIKHIQAAKVPLIVAINKMDLPGANPDMVKSQLTEYQVFVEGYGGQTPSVNVSAKKGTGLTELLDMILLVAELEELHANPAAPLEAVVIESRLDPSRGALASLIVKQGTLKSRQVYYLGQNPVKFRSLLSDTGLSLQDAKPGTPVEVMGFGDVPPIGGTLTSAPQEPPALTPEEPPPPALPEPELPQKLEAPEKEETQLPEEKPEIPPHLNVIFKADTVGTLEAIKQSVSSDLVIIDSGVGPVSESDVLLAQSTGAFILAFNVPTNSSAQKLAQLEKIKITSFKVIYELLEFLEEKILKLLEPTINEEELGVATVQAVFDIKGEHIAGCQVTSGKITKTNLLHYFRGDKRMKDLKIKSLKRGKEDINSAKAGTECGLVTTSQVDFRVGDVLKSYKIIEV